MMKLKNGKMICSHCGGPLEEKTTRVLFEQPNGLPAFIEDVPAKVCKRCGYRWFSAKVARAL